MSERGILLYPDERLSQSCKPVDDPESDRIQSLIGDLLDTVRAEEGFGLAAPQVGVNRQVLVAKRIDEKGGRDSYQVMINPRITSTSDRTKEFEEGCLSIPGLTIDVERPFSITYEAIDHEGQSFEGEAEDYQSAILQHEIDHLDGTLLFDHLSETERRLKRRSYRRKKKKLDRR